ncbi:FMI1 protein [Verticillium alfalfae VaMs.102]|uniref:Altered inheritance of mitochondria protein 32 n=1 Tax=Verticillium alfalfae (strain VaMs.102 / ATCC MYA-4576 / FGSC 10136) TaxID=526221 RepID=C9S8T3_VERA1|nr:FMI1 protein [Verticillium alfalfae VaMs.102]EEY14010.1 FMI1 protein [Verticillium alfalfae VaMs.102]
MDFAKGRSKGEGFLLARFVVLLCRGERGHKNRALGCGVEGSAGGHVPTLGTYRTVPVWFKVTILGPEAEFRETASRPVCDSQGAATPTSDPTVGRDDWASRIEEEDSGDNLAADLKELFGRGGTYSDPFHNVSVLNASFPSSTPRRRAELQTTSAYLLPSFKYVPFLPRVSFESVQALAKGYLLPEALHPVHDGLSPVHRDRLLRKEAYREMLYGVQDVQDVLVLICGHGGRDARCGITGPVLRSEFETQLDAAGVHVLKGEVEGDVEENQGRRLEEGATAHDGGGEGAPQRGAAAARVGLISHIGGHKFAGNVIVYVPPGMKAQDGTEHGLAGKGIWYGRVEPRHVEGIVKETILGGRVIADMFRGGIDQQRKILRM